MKLFILLAVVVAIVYGCTRDEWEGFVYPNKHNLTIHHNIGTFDSLESCRTAALNTLNNISSIRQGDYECGLNCRSEPYMSIKICEDTLR